MMAKDKEDVEMTEDVKMTKDVIIPYRVLPPRHPSHSYKVLHSIHPLHPRNLLIRDRAPVIFIGEGNFTFTFAFAALRQSQHPELPFDAVTVWKDITSTRYEREDEEEVPSMIQVMLGCVSSIALYYQKKVNELKMEDLEVMVHYLIHLPLDPNPKPWICNVDATTMDLEKCHVITPFFGVIWFHCPWSEERTNVGPLVEEFLLKTVQQLMKGSVVCVGIINHQNYIKEYMLWNILGVVEGQNTSVLNYYEYLGTDVELVGDVLEFGYHHKGIFDIHLKNLENHITLVFTKK